MRARADAGGHSASEATLRRIYDASLPHLRRAVEKLDAVWIYDNTDIDASHPLVLEARDGEIHFVADRPPDLLLESLIGTECRLTLPRPPPPALASERRVTGL